MLNYSNNSGDSPKSWCKIILNGLVGNFLDGIKRIQHYTGKYIFCCFW